MLLIMMAEYLKTYARILRLLLALARDQGKDVSAVLCDPKDGDNWVYHGRGSEKN
jgi:hypothetical protein